MTLPFQRPLLAAVSQLENHDYDGAAQSVDAFFRGLDTDSIAKDIRHQHAERQVFEADFLSTLTPQEIDAWQILALCRLNRGTLEDARDACYKQLELIDEFYGYATPSWKHIETRIPMHEELAPRYAAVADLLAEICTRLKDAETARRWHNVSQSAIADRHQPDQVWERWLSDGNVVAGSRDWFDLINWPIITVTVDGVTHLVQLNRNLASEASPRDCPLLMTVTIATDPRSIVPSKPVRWRIWSMRQALNAAISRSRVGVFAGESQAPGLRTLYYYLADVDESAQAIDPILNAAASELEVQLDLQEDPTWQQYLKLGGGPIIVEEPESVSLPPANTHEHLQDRLFRAAWKIGMSANEAWGRFYSLVWLMAELPPSMPVLRNYCVQYLIDLANRMPGSQRSRALVYLIWKLPKVDKDAAIRVFDQAQRDGFPTGDEFNCDLNLAAEAFAVVDPERASMICELLNGYELGWRSWLEVAKATAPKNERRARALIERVTKQLRDVQLAQDNYFAARDFAALAEQLPEELSDLVPDLLQEAESFADRIESNAYKNDMYLELSRLAKKFSHPRLESLCNKSMVAARERAKHAPSEFSFMDRLGPYETSKALAETAVMVASYHRQIALELLKEALQYALKPGDDWDQFETLTALASAVRRGEIVNPAFVNQLWDAFCQSAPNVVNLADPYIYASQVTLRKGLREAIEDFVTLDGVVACARFHDIKSVCDSAQLPELRIKLLCNFARHLGTYNKDHAQELLGTAESIVPQCSSTYLRAISFGQILTAAAACKFDTTAYKNQLFEEFPKVPGDIRYAAVLEVSNLISSADQECARQLLEALDSMSSDVTIDGLLAIARLNEMPVTISGELQLRWLEYVPPAHFLNVLCQWANKYAQLNEKYLLPLMPGTE